MWLLTFQFFKNSIESYYVARPNMSSISDLSLGKFAGHMVQAKRTQIARTPRTYTLKWKRYQKAIVSYTLRSYTVYARELSQPDDCTYMYTLGLLKKIKSLHLLCSCRKLFGKQEATISNRCSSCYHGYKSKGLLSSLCTVDQGFQNNQYRNGWFQL